jgi:hypothetical protein
MAVKNQPAIFIYSPTPEKMLCDNNKDERNKNGG